MELIELIKQAARDTVASERPVDVFIGKVVSLSPLSVIIDSRACISEENILLADRVCHHSIELSHSHTHLKSDEITQNITLSEPLCVDDLVIMLRCYGGGTYIVLDKINRKE